jgi:hypothetical protein
MEKAMTELATTTWPTLVRELTMGEYLLVGSLRRWVIGWERNEPGQWRIVEREFADAFGRQDNAPLAMFGRMINVLRLNACRPFHYHQPCCPCLGAAEACFTVVVGACQTGDALLARAACGWLVHEGAIGDLLGPASLLADAMRRRGLLLPERAATASSRRPVVADAMAISENRSLMIH